MISFWNPGTYRHKIVHLSSAQFGLVRQKFDGEVPIKLIFRRGNFEKQTRKDVLSNFWNILIRNRDINDLLVSNMFNVYWPEIDMVN